MFFCISNENSGLWGGGQVKANRVIVSVITITFENLIKRNKGPGSWNGSTLALVLRHPPSRYLEVRGGCGKHVLGDFSQWGFRSLFYPYHPELRLSDILMWIRGVVTECLLWAGWRPAFLVDCMSRWPDPARWELLLCGYSSAGGAHSSRFIFWCWEALWLLPL